MVPIPVVELWLLKGTGDFRFGASLCQNSANKFKTHSLA